MDKKSRLAMRLGLGTNILLSVLKTGVGILAHSPALLAEGINSTSDVVYYVLAAFFMRLAQQPADDEHPYGHQQFETIAALMVGAFVMTTGVAVFWNAIDKVWVLLKSPANLSGASSVALWVAFLTIAIKIFLTVLVGRLGRETGNPVVAAMAYDHRNDLASASAAAVGIFLGQRGLPWVDPLAAALVAGLIFRTGLQIVLDAADDLMDTVPSERLVKEVLAVMGDISSQVHLEEMQAHRFGRQMVINMTIGIEGNLTIYEGDALSSRIERQIVRRISGVQRVHIHYHPARAQCCNLSPEQILSRSRAYPVLDSN